MKLDTAPTYTVRLYLSGPIEVAKQTIREECLREGLCVTIEPTTFVYTGGEEAGYVVGLLNYPRFPGESAALVARARPHGEVAGRHVPTLGVDGHAGNLRMGDEA
jgi:hypothetical protein